MQNGTRSSGSLSRQYLVFNFFGKRNNKIMNFASKVENLETIYKLCLKELEFAKAHLDSYVQEITNIYSFVSNELASSDDSRSKCTYYYNGVNAISDISDFIRNFNEKCELNIEEPPVKILNETIYENNNLNSCQSSEIFQEFNQSTGAQRESEELLPVEILNETIYKNNNLNSCQYSNIFQEFNQSTGAQSESEELPPVEILNETIYKNNNLNSCQYSEIFQKFNRSTGPQRERFTYNKVNLKKFNIHSKINCRITYKDESKKLFYIVEINSIMKKCSQALHNFDPILLDHSPKEGDIFGLILNECLFRAVRENEEYANNLHLSNALLIDIGEIVQFLDSEAYCLPSELKYYEGQAILCKLEMVNSDPNGEVDLENFAKNKTKVTLEVIKVENFTLHVNLITDLNVATTSPSDYQIVNYSNNDNVNLYNNISTVSYLKSINDEHKRINDNFNVSYNTSVTNSNEYSSISSNSSSIDSGTPTMTISETSMIDDDKSTLKNSKILTAEQMEILNEEPLNITNVLQAVTGYIPKDDSKICKFYNKKMGSCFKGSKCKYEHIEKLEDGWTRDKSEIVVDIKNQTIIPRIGSEVLLFVTHVVNIEYFYAQYSPNESQTSFKNLTQEMNTAKQISNYKMLQDPPAVLQLVIGFCKSRNIWCRAQIVDVIDDNTFKVFFVDYGDTCTLSMNEIRDRKIKFEYLPFQAIKCHIFGIKAKLDERDASAVEYFKKMILNKNIIAKIKSIFEENILVIEADDTEGFDIGKKLITMNYAVLKEELMPINFQRIPG